MMLCSCSGTPIKEPGQEKEKPQPLTGRQAFQHMFPMARSWVQDAAPVQLKSIDLAKVPASPGMAGAWEAIFYSPSLAKTKTYTWSALESAGNLHQGVFAGNDESSGPQKTFDISALRIDSDEAYKIALAKSADYIEKHPKMPVLFIVELNNRFPELAWRVIWGESVATSDYSVFVEAATGRFIEKAH